MSNLVCVISLNTFGEYGIRDIQTNSSWTKNPYTDYVVVPEELIEGVLATEGFCDIELNKDRTEIVSFTPLPIPEIPMTVADDEPTLEERVKSLENRVNELVKKLQ